LHKHEQNKGRRKMTGERVTRREIDIRAKAVKEAVDSFGRNLDKRPLSDTELKTAKEWIDRTVKERMKTQ
jgi:hypothetical protein